MATLSADFRLAGDYFDFASTPQLAYPFRIIGDQITQPPTPNLLRAWVSTAPHSVLSPRTSKIKIPMQFTILAVAAALGAHACNLRAPHAVVVIDDPGGLATFTTHVAVASAPSQEDNTQTPFRALSFPASITVTGSEPGPGQVWLAALDEAGNILAHCAADVDFTREPHAPARCTLGIPCGAHDDCNDGVFCNGEEMCRQRVCTQGRHPCSAAFECMDSTCIEDTQQCVVAVHHSRCAPVAAADGGLDPTYCSPSAGCIRGQPCYEDSDCDDESYCNGSEVCRSGKCFAGAVPLANDQNPCTLDGCTEKERIVHISMHRSLCTLGASIDGICEASQCVASRCGDGALDPRTGEQCDDGVNNSDNTSDACRRNCQLARCGDGVTDHNAGESCDDGNSSNDDSCVGQCVQSLCGDGYLHVGVEACDDGNDADDDGCLVTCRLNVCGDGIRAPLTEACDDGNRSDSDDCAGCEVAFCGDGHVHAAVEACDDGDTIDGSQGPGPRCSGDCSKEEICGDRILDTGESCDDGNANPNDGCDACLLTAWHPTIVLGIGEDAGKAVGMRLQLPQEITSDAHGIVYFADSSLRLWRYDPDAQRVTHFAGSARTGYSGDGGPATQADFSEVTALATDSLGNVFMSNRDESVVRKIDHTGIISTVAGTGTQGFSGDGGPATLAMLVEPHGLAVAGDGTLYICDSGNFVVRKVSPDGIITTVAGNPGLGGFTNDLGGVDALGPNAVFNYPNYIAIGLGGELYVSDVFNDRIRKIDYATGTGVLSTVAGPGSVNEIGDGRIAPLGALLRPAGVQVDSAGDLYIADTEHHRIRKVNSAGIITTIAGRGLKASDGGYDGDGGQATQAALGFPIGLTLTPDGDIYIGDHSNNVIRRVTPNGIITTAIGGSTNVGAARFADVDGFANSAWLAWPVGVSTGPTGELLFTERIGNRVSSIAPDGTLQAVVTATVEASPANLFQANILHPSGANYDGAGNLYVLSASKLHKFSPTTDLATHLTTLIDSPAPGNYGDGIPSIDAQVGYLFDFHVTNTGEVYLVDGGSHMLRKIDANGIITTVAGVGFEGYSGDGGPALLATMREPKGIVVDADGTIFFSDTGNHVVRKISAAGVVTTIAGQGLPGFSGDGGQASLATLNLPQGLAIDVDSALLIADHDNGRVRRLDLTSQIITTLAGTATRGHSGDFGLATEASLAGPVRIAVHPDGSRYITSSGNSATLLQQRLLEVLPHSDNFIRRVTPDGVITTVAGVINPGDGSFTHAFLGAPSQSVPFKNNGQWLVADGISGRVRLVDFPGDSLQTVAGYPGGLTDMQNPSRLASQSRLIQDASGIAYDATTNTVFVSERDGHTIRKLQVVDPVDPSTWTISPFVGVLGAAGHSDGPIATAQLKSPAGLALHTATRTLYIADAENHVLRRVDLATEVVTTYAGIPTISGSAPQALPRWSTTFNNPQGLALAPDGRLYVADTGNHRVRLIDVDASGTTTTVLGTGVPSSAGVGAPASSLPVDSPTGLALDGYGNLFIGSLVSVRRVAAGADGQARGDDIASTIYGSVPRDSFPQSVIRCISSVNVAPGNDGLYVMDACQGFLVHLERL